MSDHNWKPGHLNMDDTPIFISDKTQDFSIFDSAGYGNFIPPTYFRMTANIARQALSVRSNIEGEYRSKLNSLPGQLQAELASNGASITATSTPTDPVTIARDKRIIDQMINLNTTRFQSSSIEANSFYGSDPHNKSQKDYIETFDTYMRRQRGAGIKTQKHWMKSYTAGYSARLYAESIRLLTEHSNRLNAAQAQAQALAREEAARKAATEAKRKAEQESKDIETLKNQRKNANTIDKLNNRFYELAKGLDRNEPRDFYKKLNWLKDKQGQLLSAHNNVRQVENEARPSRLLQTKVSAGHESILQNLQEDIDATVRAIRKLENVNMASADGALSTSRALMVSPDGLVIGYETLPVSLSGAFDALKQVSATIGRASTVLLTSIFYTPMLGDGELQRKPLVFTIPLSQFVPGNNYPSALLVGGSTSLPNRVVSTARGGHIQLYLSNTGKGLPAEVRVRKAIYNPYWERYTFTTEGMHPRTLIWTPASAPGSKEMGSTELPIDQPDIKIYPGARITPVEGRTDDHPACDEGDIDDYILVFPAESGIDPVYIMASSTGPRHEPGTVTGTGQTVGENWLGSASKQNGAPIPKQIADQLRGQDFRSFRKFREKFWKAVVNDAVLSKQFGKVDSKQLRGGAAPFADPDDQVGGRKKFEIHHKQSIVEGGAVYDSGNLTILTPKAHIDLHKNGVKP